MIKLFYNVNIIIDIEYIDKIKESSVDVEC